MKVNLNQIELGSLGEGFKEAIDYATQKIKKKDIGKIKIVSSPYGVVILVFGKNDQLLTNCLVG